MGVMGGGKVWVVPVRGGGGGSGGIRLGRKFTFCALVEGGLKFWDAGGRLFCFWGGGFVMGREGLSWGRFFCCDYCVFFFFLFLFLFYFIYLFYLI